MRLHSPRKDIMNKKEIWAKHPILNVEVSNKGRVKGVRTKFLKPFFGKAGYQMIRLYFPYQIPKSKTFSVHRLCWQAFHGEIPKGFVINHKNYNTSDNRLENLECITQAANNVHARKRKFKRKDKSIYCKIDTLYPEIWKEHPTLEREISNYGRMKCLKKTGRGITVGTLNNNGYLMLRINGKGYLSSRLVAETFIGSIPDKFVVNHKDGNKTNNRADNLEICSFSDNVLHSYTANLNRKRVGEEMFHKITEKQVLSIYDSYIKGNTKTEIAKKYNISRGHVLCIIRGQSWSHLMTEDIKRKILESENLKISRRSPFAKDDEIEIYNRDKNKEAFQKLKESFPVLTYNLLETVRERVEKYYNKLEK